MADRDTLKILKYFVGIIMAVLLSHECVVETLDLTQTSTDLQSNTDEQMHHRPRPRRAAITPTATSTTGLPYRTSSLTNFSAAAAITTTAISPKCFPAGTSSSTNTSVFTVKMSKRIEEVFDTSLNDPNDEKYKLYANRTQSEIEDTFKNVSTYIKGSARVTGFRPGSIIVDYTINVTTNCSNSYETVIVINAHFHDVLTVPGNPLRPVPSIYQLVQTNLSTAEKLYPQQDMVLNCIRPELLKGAMLWWIPDSVTNTSYFLSANNSTLTVKNVSETDSGRYECIINGTIPYIQWQDIVIEPLPTIIVDNSVKVFECADQTIQLRCCEERYDVEWTPIPSSNQVTAPDKGCITLNHKIASINCETEIFTCQIKNPALRDFDYGRKSVIVHKVIAEFTCKNESLGDGKEGDIRTGPCENGWKGSITYQCISGKWEPVNRTCVLLTIKDLEKKAEVLFVQDIPMFMAELRYVTVQNTQEITQSLETVQTIVGILVKIADISQTIIISKPVMEDFLKTVDIIVSDETINSWHLLKSRITGDSSVALLRAIENIGGRLTDSEFTIKVTSIELTRTSIISSYSGISTLPNSATEILIPQVLEPTAITIIIFSRLNKVLPTRKTTNDDFKTSVSRINGDVVVVKGNQTLKNIVFTFDIIETSLGNPECVFWDFDLNAWSSTGCEVKPFVKETGKVTCKCNHTTSFSILMSPLPEVYITYTGVAISMAFLIVSLIIEIIVWKSVTRNMTSYMRHVSVVNIAMSLLIANICFIIGAALAEQEQPISVGRCSPAVFFMHVFYLALFFWMLILALLLLYRTVMLLSQMSRAKITAIAFTVGYGAPLLIAAITVASTAGPQNYITKSYACWLNWSESKSLLAFVVPALTIVVINLVLLSVALYKMLKTDVGAATQADEKHALVVIIRFVAFLTPLFGLTWGFGLGTVVSHDFGIHMGFALLNSLQGFFILVFGTLFDSKIREALSGKLKINFNDQSELRIFSAAPSSNSSMCSDTFMNG